MIVMIVLFFSQLITKCNFQRKNDVLIFCLTLFGLHEQCNDGLEYSDESSSTWFKYFGSKQEILEYHRSRPFSKRFLVKKICQVIDQNTRFTSRQLLVSEETELKSLLWDLLP